MTNARPNQSGSAEDDAARDRRRSRRVTFDSVADLYDASRPTYPGELVQRLVSAAELRHGARLLEVGCGSGQLTQDLVGRGFDVMALDPGGALVDRARRRIGADAATLLVTTFEEFDAPTGSFDLVVSASAFHWVDPDIRWKKSAALLRPGGWLAIIDTIVRYDDALQATLSRLWLEHSDDGGAWAQNPPPTMRQQLDDSGLFADIIDETFVQHQTLDSSVVQALPQTAGAFLSYNDEQKVSFVTKWSEALHDDAVSLELGGSLLMGRVREP